MMKFFRKYMRQMLAVFVSLLLVAWLGGQALETMLKPDPTAETVGYAFGSELRVRDMIRATSETQILASIGLPWSQPWAMMRGGQMVRAPGIEELDWLLLRKEAIRQGVPVTDTEVIEFLTSIDQSGTLRQQLQKRINVSMATIEETVADHLRIVKLGQVVGNARKVTEPELKRAIADFQEKVEIRLVVLNGETFADETGEITDADLEKHFKAYQDVVKGEGKYGFGYRFPERVKIEYVSVDTESIAEDVRIPSLQARRFWRENKELPIFRRPDPPSTQPTGTQAASGPSTQPESEFFTTFAEAEAAAVKHLKEERAEDAATALLNRMLSQLRVDFASGKRLAGGYRQAPESVRAAGYYSSILNRFKSGPNGEALELHAPDELMTREQLAELPGIGRSSVMGGSTGMPPEFVDVAFQVQGLTEIPEGDDVNRSHYTSLYQTFISPLRGTDGKYYIFRVVAVEGPRPAASLSEVADAVKADVKRLRGHLAAEKAARRLEQEAKEIGLEPAWADEEDLKNKVGPLEGYQAPPAFGRRGASVAGLAGHEEFAEACFALAAATPQSLSEKVRRIELPKSLKWTVVELVKFHPMVKDRYEQMKTFMQSSLAMQKQSEVLADWFEPSTIRARTGYRPITKEMEEDTKEKPAEASAGSKG